MMREIFAILVLIALCTPCHAIDSDKEKHFTISALFGMGTGAVAATQTEGHLTDYAIAATVATLPGLWKEIIDDGTPGNRFDTKDLLYDSLGAIVGVAIAGGGYRLFYNGESVAVSGRW